MITHRLCLLACLMAPSALSQTASMPPPPTPAAFRASLVKMQKEQLPEWKRSLDQVVIEELPVGYAQGKLIEKTRDTALQWIKICDISADHALRSNALADDVLLSSNITELFHSMEDVSSILADVGIARGATDDKRIHWMQQIGDLSGTVNDLSQSALSFTVARADELERQCHTDADGQRQPRK